MDHDISKRQPVRIRIRDFRDRKPTLTFSGFLIKDPSLSEIVRSVEIYGSDRSEISLMRLSGDLVEFTVIPSKDTKVEQFGLGRLHYKGWTTFSEIEQPMLQQIGEIKVAKFTTIRPDGDRDAPELVSYVYANNISGWPSAGMFGLSYDGTISRHKFRNGLDILISAKRFKATADYYYLFEKDGEHLNRKRLCSITVEPRGQDVDLERSLASVRATMSFVYEADLKPLKKISIYGNEYKVIEFPQENVEITDREFYARPIHVQGQKNFTSLMIRWLYNSSFNISDVEYAIKRYISASRSLPLESSFSAGCEAIEALFAIVCGGAKSTEFR